MLKNICLISIITSRSDKKFHYPFFTFKDIFTQNLHGINARYYNIINQRLKTGPLVIEKVPIAFPEIASPLVHAEIVNVSSYGLRRNALSTQEELVKNHLPQDSASEALGIEEKEYTTCQEKDYVHKRNMTCALRRAFG